MQLFGKPLKLVVLDVDGVIIDVVDGLQRDLVRTAIRVGLPIGPLQRFFNAVAAGEEYWQASLQDGIRKFWPELSSEETLAFAWQFQDTRRQNPWPLLEGSTEVIQWFRQRGVPVALCTTNDRPTLEHQLLSVGVDLTWFTVFSTWECGTPKPDPRALDPIFEAVTVLRHHAVYVGDWYPDLEAARGAGVPFVAVLSGGIPRREFIKKGVSEDHILDRLADLPKLIEP